MRLSDRFLMALRNLSRRKSRTILTILSVVIGATSIILMLAFAEGINASQREMIESFQGLTTINIYSETGELNIDDKMINDLQRIENVSTVVPSKNIYAQILIKETDEYEIDGSINVIPDNVINMFDQSMMEWGTPPNPSDDNKLLLSPNSSVMKMTKQGDMFMYDPVDDFDFNAYTYKVRLGFQSENQIDDGVNFGNPENIDDDVANKPEYIDVDIEIAGQLNSSSGLDGWGSYISESTYDMLKKEDAKIAYPSLVQEFDMEGNPIKSTDDKIKYDNLSVIVDDSNNVPAVEKEIRSLGYQTNSMSEAAKEIESQSKTVMMILGGIGSIAFIVSAIGIINTMLMSIYERQKEIGVMKVIGASISDIQTMFLIESGFIGFFGGILGLIISILIANLINGFLAGAEEMFQTSKIVVIPIWLMIVGVGFSALVGVLAGFLPARRATKLSAIDALRAN